VIILITAIAMESASPCCFVAVAKAVAKPLPLVDCFIEKRLDVAGWLWPRLLPLHQDYLVSRGIIVIMMPACYLVLLLQSPLLQ